LQFVEEAFTAKPSFLNPETFEIWKTLTKSTTAITDQARFPQYDLMDHFQEFSPPPEDIPEEIGRAEEARSPDLMPWRQPPSITTGSTHSNLKNPSSKHSSPLKDYGFDFSNQSQISHQDISNSFQFDQNEELDMIFPETQGKHVDEEVISFYRYISTIMEEAGTDYVYLFDVLQEHSNRVTASQAFFNMLMLATQGYCSIEQKDIYGDIQIKNIQ
jgi:hypothetical protein